MNELWPYLIYVRRVFCLCSGYTRGKRVVQVDHGNAERVFTAVRFEALLYNGSEITP